jgi:hypothetical protein
MTKGRVMLPWRVLVGRKAIFITLGGPQAHDLSVELSNLLQSSGHFYQGLQSIA